MDTPGRQSGPPIDLAIETTADPATTRRTVTGPQRVAPRLPGSPSSGPVGTACRLAGSRARRRDILAEA